MSGAPPLTTDLALRIEKHVAIAALSDTPLIREFGETLAGKAIGGRPRNRVFCFGKADLSRLTDILAFYAIDNVMPRFSLSPARFSPEVAEALIQPGFGQDRFEQAILYGLPSKVPAPLPASMTIERVTSNNLNEYVRAVADGFEWPDEWRDVAMDGIRAGFKPENGNFLARCHGEPAGVASIDWDSKGVAMLGQGAVIPKFRNGGFHFTLVQHRLHVAHELGCNLVLGGAAFNSTSFRNQQRAGLRLAYIESEWGILERGGRASAS